MKSYKELLPQVKAFAFDVDGVMTNGEVLLYKGDVVRSLHSKDGYVLHLASKLGYPIFIITGGNSQEVKDRILEQGVTEVHLRSSDKLSVFNDICKRHNLQPEDILYMGDDIPDIPVLRVVGVSTCPSDAAADVKAVCHYQSPIEGGKGCVRDVIEQVLRVQGKWLTEEGYHW